MLAQGSGSRGRRQRAHTRPEVVLLVVRRLQVAHSHDLELLPPQFHGGLHTGNGSTARCQLVQGWKVWVPAEHLGLSR